jgi:general secretion pathway protein I
MMSLRSSRLPRHARGFSLIEMVAAFLVFALAVAMLMSILTSSLRATRQSADYTQAALRAQSLLDAVGVGVRLEEGRSSGDFGDGFRWELEVAPADATAIEPPPQQSPQPGMPAGPGQAAPAQTTPAGELVPASPVDLYDVVLDVFWGSPGRERTARFVTLRALNPDPKQSLNLPGVPGAGTRVPGGK